MVPVSELQAGRIIGGRYRIEALLGSGGMGVLYVAEHLFTHRKVALKLLHPSREDDREQLHARFLSEARTASAVRHPHVVDVLDMGTDEEGQPFLVMELLEGRSLDRVLTSEQRVSPESAIAWTLPIAAALAALHDAGIVHRDVKPSNIFLCRTPQGRIEPKLLDFGLARAVSDLRLTRSGVVIGTPLYMSPEHAAGEAVGPQADVWSLGVVLYECLSGETPYQSKDGAAVAAQVLAGHVRPLHLVCPELPQPLLGAVERALRRDLAHRYRNMRELIQGLLAGAHASGIPVSISQEIMAVPGVANLDLSAAPTLEQQTPPSKSSVRKKAAGTRSTASRARRAPWAWLGLLAVGVFLAWWLTRGSAPAIPTAESAEKAVPKASPAAPEPRPVVVPLSAEEPSAAPVDNPPAPKATPAPSAPSNERTSEPKRSRRRRNNEDREVRKQLDVETEWK